MPIKIVSSIKPDKDKFQNDKQRYEWQIEARANLLLIGDDAPHVPITVHRWIHAVCSTSIKWIGAGELISGSFMCGIVSGADPVQHNDIDIYFKTKEDALLFAEVNGFMLHANTDSNVSTFIDSLKLNLVYGVKYKTPVDLISRFDIRACSIAYDPIEQTSYHVTGALGDCRDRRIVFNPVPHNTTVARLVKYVEKGFQIDAYQRLFFANLISDKNYNPDLELTTGYRGTSREGQNNSQ